MDRPDLKHVLQAYQVAADETITYRPRLLGVKVPLDTLPAFEGKTAMTKTEGALLDGLIRDRSPSELIHFARIRAYAEGEAERRYPPTGTPPEGLNVVQQAYWHRNDGHADAFRHACWNALLTQRYGDDWANKFSTAHEGGPRNPASREAMDLYNNEVGRTIGAAYPNASFEELADHVQNALAQGKLVVIDTQGELAWSDQVAIGRHGVANDPPAAPMITTPESKDAALKERPWNSVSSTDGNHSSERQHMTKDMLANEIYRSCSHGVDALDARMGRAPDQASACMKASLAHLAASHHLDRVDHVLLSQQAPGVAAGQYVFVVQGDPANPAHLRAHMPTDQAVKTPEETSLKELHLAMESRTAQQTNDLQQQQQRDMHLRGA